MHKGLTCDDYLSYKQSPHLLRSGLEWGFLKPTRPSFRGCTTLDPSSVLCGAQHSISSTFGEQCGRPAKWYRPVQISRAAGSRSCPCVQNKQGQKQLNSLQLLNKVWHFTSSSQILFWGLGGLSQEWKNASNKSQCYTHNPKVNITKIEGHLNWISDQRLVQVFMQTLCARMKYTVVLYTTNMFYSRGRKFSGTLKILLNLHYCR